MSQYFINKYLLLTLCSVLKTSLTMTEENPATKVFRDYIRIPSVQPDPDYYQAVEFLVEQAQSLGLPYRTHECCPGKPILIITWEGSEPSLPSVILNSHMDVVPVFPEHWTYQPFSAFKVGLCQCQSWEGILDCNVRTSVETSMGEEPRT